MAETPHPLQAASRGSGLLSQVTYQLHAPLNAILGFADLLELTHLDSKQRECVDCIKDAAGRLSDLIVEVLETSRIEAGTVPMAIERVSLEGVVREALDLLRPEAATRRISVTADVAGIAGRHVLGDPRRLEQVLLTILSNAVRSTRPRGRVSLSWREAGGRIRLGVTSDGAISPDEVDGQPEASARRRVGAPGVEGTPPALMRSQSLLLAMGGSLDIETVPEAAATVWIGLAVSEPPKADDEPAVELSGAPERPPGDRAVLYVDDNLENIRLMQHVLERRPHLTLLPATQGTHALQLARDHRPDLILLDLHLRDIEGDEVLLSLQADERTARIPVVVLSAETSQRDVDRLLGAGARAYLTKPLDVRRLLALLDEIAAATPEAQGSPPEGAQPR